MNLTDPVRLLGLLFLGQEDPGHCLDAADVSDNGTVDISDAIGSLGFQFLGEKEPAPWPLCGADSLPEETPSLGC